MLVCCEICGCVFSGKDGHCPLCRHSVEFSHRVSAFGGNRAFPKVLFAVCVFLTASAITWGLVQYSLKYARPRGVVVFDLDGVQQARITDPAEAPQANVSAATPPAVSGREVAQAPPSLRPRTLSTETIGGHRATAPERTPTVDAAHPDPAPVEPSTSAEPAPRHDEPSGKLAGPASRTPARNREAEQRKGARRVPLVRRPGVPAYALLHEAPEYRSERVFAEVLVPSLSADTPVSERQAIIRAIAELEGFHSAALYCTPQAHYAHYSMDYADRHPNALAEGLLGTYEGGRFKPYRR